MRNKGVIALFALLASLILAACGGQTPTAAPTTAPAAGGEATPAPAGESLAVGIVLPTRDEPRWIQDET
ncbi:MAG TPA: hypothetical protein PKD53_21235, partial [Chloroflexaceae bacterium]|nr:hypothetical protein [Chloroflexaceae bacterium]